MMRMTRLLTMLALSFSASAWAAYQSTPVTVDGNISDIDATSMTVQTDAQSFGAGLAEILNMRVSHDDTYLYLGVAAKFDTAGGTRGIWILLDTKAGGIDTLVGGFGPGGAQGMAGTVLETGFGADYMIFAQNGNSGSLQSYYWDMLDYGTSSATYYGEFRLTDGTFTPSGSVPAGLEADVDNSATNGDFNATTGFEFKIPMAALGITGTYNMHVLVGSGDGGNGYWSSQSLPPSNNGGSNLGQNPNFETNTVGAFATDGGFSQSQTFGSEVPVELSSFQVN